MSEEVQKITSGHTPELELVSFAPAAKPLLADSAEFYIGKGYLGKQLVKGKVLKTNSGQKFCIHATGIRDFGEKNYRPIISVTCLKTGYHLAAYKSEKEVLDNLEWIDVLLNSKERKNKILEMKRKGIPMLNDLRHFR